MKGSIRERKSTSKNGRHSFQIQVYTGKDPVTGKRNRHFETVNGSRADAQRKLNKLLVELDDGHLKAASSRMTLSELTRSWLDVCAKTKCSEKTWDYYETYIRNHINRYLGSTKLKDLSTAQIQQFYGDESKRISRTSVHHVHRILDECLRYAVRQGYLAYNPCILVDPPVRGKTPVRALSQSEANALCEAGKDSYYFPAIYTALCSGVRQGELLALTWRDISFDSCLISINRSVWKRRGVPIFKDPKTAGSRRAVGIPENLVTFLRDYKIKRQRLVSLMGRTLSPDDLVFTSTSGQVMCSSTLSKSFRNIAASVGIKGVRFHDLRHTYASLMILSGVSVKVISHNLGHSSAAMTLDIYSHLLPGMGEDAMLRFNRVIPTVARLLENGKLTATE